MSGDRSLDWGCSECKGSDYSDGDRLRAARGCEGKDVESLGFEFDGSLRQCPWAVIDRETWELVRWWSDWITFKSLPWGGSDPMGQPAKVLEVLDLCETEKRKAERQQREKQRAESEKAARRANRGR